MRHAAKFEELPGEVSLLLHARYGDEQDEDKHGGGRDSDGGQKPKGDKSGRR